MTEEELNPQEREALELLRSNDPRAATTLAALDDSGRARVLAQMSGTSAPQESYPSDGIAASDQPTADGAEGSEEVSEEVPPDPDADDAPLDPSSSKADDASGPDPKADSDASSRAGSLPAVFNQALATTAGKAILAVVGAVLILLIILVVRSCGGGGDPSSDALLLVRESGGDLYVGRANAEIDRDDRVVRDFDGLTRITVTRDGAWWSAGLVEVGSRRILVADTQDGDGAWVIEGSDVEEIVSESGNAGVVVVGDILYLRESREGTQRCYRGSLDALDDLERMFRGDACTIAYSGHILGASSSGDSYRVTVWSPQGDETALSRANFQGLPSISDNGRFVVSRDDDGVTVTGVDTGDRIWELDGGVNFDLASHPDGHIALVAEASSGEVYLVAVDAEGNADEILEVRDGQLVAEFAPSGDLFWLESKEDDRGILSVWDASQKEVFELADEEGLRLIGVHEGAAVTVIEDDLGALFQRFLPTDTDGTELHEFDDGVQGSLIYGDFLYVAGSEIASVIPLNGDEATDSLTWDAINILDVSDGLLIAVGTDGSSEVLFGIRSGAEDDVEYGEFDDVVSAQAYGSTLYATVRDGLGLETLVFDASSGDAQDDGPDYDGYRLVTNRIWPIRSILFAVGYAQDITLPEVAFADPEPEPFAVAKPAAAPPTTTAAPPTTVSDATPEPEAPAPQPEEAEAPAPEPAGGYYSGRLVGPGDSNRYFFEIPDGGRWLFAETYGQIDVVADLFLTHSDGSTIPVASSDDDGTDSNARFEIFLDPGTYFIEVGGYDNDVTGSYELRIDF